jgi:hypothetical protein
MALNSYVKLQVLWYKNNTTATDITRFVRNISTDKNNEPRNNVCNIRLFDNDVIYGSNDKFLPQENDLIIVYAKIIEDNSDTALDSGDIIWTGKFVDHQRTQSPDEKTITFKVVDYAYDIFNRFWSKNYADEGMTTDEIVVDIVKNMVEDDEGLRTYKLGFSNVETTRNDTSLFPEIEPNLFNKPVYEWISELGTTAWTNWETEIDDGSTVNKKPMVFDIKGTECYWYYPDGAVVLTLSNTSDYFSIKQETQNEKTANFIILECGDDLNGEPIFTYVYDKLSNSPVQKDNYQLKTNIGGRDTTYEDANHPLRIQAADEGWSNTTFAAAVRKSAESYAEYWFTYVNRNKPVLSVTLPKTDLSYGDRVYIGVPRYDIGTYEVESVSHNISEKEWTTTIRIRKEAEET